MLAPVILLHLTLASFFFSPLKNDLKHLDAFWWAITRSFTFYFNLWLVLAEMVYMIHYWKSAALC